MMNTMRLYYFNRESYEALTMDQSLILAYSYSYKIISDQAVDTEVSHLRIIEG